MYIILYFNPFNGWRIMKNEQEEEMVFETLEEAKKEVAGLIKEGVSATCIRIIQEIPFEIEVK